MSNGPVWFSTIAVSNNFSYRIVPADTVIFIAYEQQMSVYDQIEIQLNGEINLEGEIVIYE